MMDFFKTLLVLLKRWYVALPVFAVTVGAAGAVYVAMPLHYESTGVIVLTSPASGPTSSADKVNGQTNPLLAFESSLSISASIVIQSINTPEVVKSLGADKPDHTFTLTGGSDGGPFITIKTDSASEEGARQLAIQVLDKVKDELSKRQQVLGAPPSTFIRVDDVVSPTKPEPLRGGKIRAAGVALVLGLIASLGAVYGLETLQQRKRRRAGLDDDDLDEGAVDPDEDEPQAEREDEPVRAAAEPVRRPAGPPPNAARAPQPMRGDSLSERTQRVRPVGAANGAPVNGANSGQLPPPSNPSGPLNRRQGQGNRSPEEYREPPTVRVQKPTQVAQAAPPAKPAPTGQSGQTSQTGQSGQAGQQAKPAPTAQQPKPATPKPAQSPQEPRG
ncbi:hypothetical protein [Actinokineospora enzanensis]|uniref:hypothetical protein n=1 Tax=Actinokineospora enzanensis TaxID=155975 RepID=UPI00036E7C5B|nr:hypothetical protein [Actinokineospora enzanensis]